MNFDYSTLKRLAREGDVLGNWKGKPVFSCSASELENKSSGAYFILYDDDNKIVGRDGKYFYSYGDVSGSGNVSEYTSRRRYNLVCETVHDHSYENVPAAVSTNSYAPGYDVTERPTGDVKTEIDVDAALTRAREMTIADLLVGFNVGV